MIQEISIRAAYWYKKLYTGIYKYFALIPVCVHVGNLNYFKLGSQIALSKFVSYQYELSFFIGSIYFLIWLKCALVGMYCGTQTVPVYRFFYDHTNTYLIIINRYAPLLSTEYRVRVFTTFVVISYSRCKIIDKY